jgi:hypothetical protein
MAIGEFDEDEGARHLMGGGAYQGDGAAERGDHQLSSNQANRLHKGSHLYRSVDSSVKACGYTLGQYDGLGRKRPARFGSITCDKRELGYSQYKIEIYGLFRH